MRHEEAAREIAGLALGDLEAIADEMLPQYRCYKLPRPALEALLVPMLVLATTPRELEGAMGDIQYHPTPVVGWYERDNGGKGSYGFKHLA